MNKKVLWSFGIMTSIALVFMVSSAPAQAVTATATLTNVSATSTAAGATNVTWTATLTVNTALSANTDLTFGFIGNVPMEEGFDLSGATVAITGASGTSENADSYDYMSEDRVNFRLSGTLSTGVKTVTISGVTNPTAAGLFQMGVEIRVPGSEGPGEQISSTTPVAVGEIAIMGKIKMPNGSLVSDDYGVGINARTEDFTQNFGTGVNGGWYAFPKTADPGAFQAGTTYFLEIWPGSAPGVVSPDAVPVAYNGTTVTKHLTFVTASKTLNVTVKTTAGAAVTTANVWANKRDGGGHLGGDVDSTGKVALSMSGGPWEVGLGCGWNSELNQQQDCNWTYNDPPVLVEFESDSSTETKSITLYVTPTNAKINGTVYYYDSNSVKQLLPGGWVDVRSGERGGAGAGINNQGPDKGKFSANVVAGNYIVSVHPDEHQYPELSQYYMDEIKVSVAVDETKNLIIYMQKKSSKIVVTVKDTSGNLVESVWVNTWAQGVEDWANAQTGSNGKAALWVKGGSQYGVEIDQGRREEGGTHYISAMDHPVDVTVASGATATANLTVEIADAVIQVTVVNENGNAVTNFWGGAHCRVPNMFGPGKEFHTGLDRGSGTIYAKAGTYTCGAWLPPEMESSLEEEIEVIIASGQTKSVQLVLVPNDSAIIGFLKDQNGRLITYDAEDVGDQMGPGGGIGEVFAVTTGDWQWRQGRLNSDGSFRISVRGGSDNKFMIGFHPWDRQNSEFMESHPEPESAFSVPANTEVTKVLTVYRATTSISGTVYFPDGTPASHVWVDAGNWKAHEGKMLGDFEGGMILHVGTDTDDSGNYTLRLIDDLWSVHAGLPPHMQGDYMPPEEVDQRVSSGSPATGVDLWFKVADAHITATASFADGSQPMFGWCWAWSDKGYHSGHELMDGTARIPVTSGDGSVTYQVGCDTHNPADNKFYRAQEQQVTVGTGDDKSVSFTLVEEIWDMPDSFSQTFTATQFNSFTMPDGTTVDIPANAAGSDDSTYTFMAEPKTELFHTSDTNIPMYAWDFSITKVDSNGNQELVETFQSNVMITITVPAAVVDEFGLTADEWLPKVYNENAGAWQTPTGISVYENEDGSITGMAQTDHFTEFAMTTGVTAAAGMGGPQYIVATPISGGGPQVTVWDADGNIQLNFFAYSSDLRIGIQAAVGDVNNDGNNEIIVAPGQGAGPHVRVFDLQGNLLHQFFVFAEHLRVGINLAVADVDDDGVAEIIVTTMAGAGPQIRIFDGAGNVESQFFAYAETFRGGVNMITGDIDNDGTPEIVVVPQSNAGPQVRAFEYDGTVVTQFYAYADTIRGGYHVTTGDVNDDGTDDILVTPGPGLGPQVAMFTGEGDLINRFFAFADTFRGGLNVSVGDVNGDGSNNIVATPESNAGPQVRTFDTAGNPISQYWAYAETLRGNFMSVVADVNQDGTMDIVTAPGEGMGPQVRVFNNDGYPMSQYFTHHPGFRGGINITTIPVF